MKRSALAKQALDIDPSNVDAYNILAESAAFAPEEAIGYYEEGMRIGLSKLSTGFIQQNKGRAWDSVRIRPFLRAKAGVARKCMELGRLKEAILHNEEILELDPLDHMKVHNALITIFLEMKHIASAQTWVDKYRADASIHFVFNEVLVQYLLTGIDATLQQLWDQAKQISEDAAAYLVSTKKIAATKNEAVQYVHAHQHLWDEQPELIAWAKKQLN